MGDGPSSCKRGRNTCARWPQSKAGKADLCGSEKPLDCDIAFHYMRICPKSHVPVGVRRTSNGEEFGKVPGTNPSSRFSGQPDRRGHLEATTVRAFLVSAGCPNAGVTEEAHLHCRTCGRGHPSNPWQTKFESSLWQGAGSPVRVACHEETGSPSAVSQGQASSFVIRFLPGAEWEIPS
jgi:hypothetical protein